MTCVCVCVWVSRAHTYPGVSWWEEDSESSEEGSTHSSLSLSCEVAGSKADDVPSQPLSFLSAANLGEGAEVGVRADRHSRLTSLTSYPLRLSLACSTLVRTGQAGRRWHAHKCA